MWIIEDAAHNLVADGDGKTTLSDLRVVHRPDGGWTSNAKADESLLDAQGRKLTIREVREISSGAGAVVTAIGEPTWSGNGWERVTTYAPTAAADLASAKSMLIAEVKAQQGSLLAQTDWAVIRHADTGIAVPANIQLWRNDIRLAAAQMEDAISQAATTDAIAALFVTYTSNPDGSVTKTGVLYDWPILT